MERLFPDGQLSNPRPVGAMGQPQALVQVPDCGLNVIRWDDWGDPQSSQRLRSILHNPGSPVADAEQEILGGVNGVDELFQRLGLWDLRTAGTVKTGHPVRGRVVRHHSTDTADYASRMICGVRSPEEDV